MNESNAYTWTILAAIAVVVLYLKGYIKIPAVLRRGVVESADPFEPPMPAGVDRLTSYDLQRLLGDAIAREAMAEAANRKATESIRKLREEMVAPFFDGTGDRPQTPVPPMM